MRSFLEYYRLRESSHISYETIASFLQDRAYGPLADYLNDQGYEITEDQIRHAIANPSEGTPIGNETDMALRLMRDLNINGAPSSSNMFNKRRIDPSNRLLP